MAQKEKTRKGGLKTRIDTQPFPKPFLKENDNEQLTVGDLYQKMREYLGGEEPYTKEYMKKKLMKTLDSDIVTTNIQGKDSVVTIRMIAEKILHQFWEQRKESETSTEKFRIIHTAAKLILADIKDIQYSKDFYPTREVVGDLEEM
ncbi:hypothetical protein PoB_005945600 [Plakobranchus ocellatus]|uniref:Uncharacterized protein n=1 Tax=Plakobranchus ocellatus TaxID=259542 RepID=A0AAV4CCA2_9GAST|nr:hypothetical protein PoB_005945600 [Plakobranchus ocellatus]